MRFSVDVIQLISESQVPFTGLELGDSTVVDI